MKTKEQKEKFRIGLWVAMRGISTAQKNEIWNVASHMYDSVREGERERIKKQSQFFAMGTDLNNSQVLPEDCYLVSKKALTKEQENV